MLTAIYDLSASPPTYDFVAFLVAAELARIECREEALRVAIVPGPHLGFRRDNALPQDAEARRGMLDRVVIPMCGLLPSCSEVAVQDRASIRADGPVFPAGADRVACRHYGMPVIVENAQANCFPLRPRRVADLPPRTVTITLREAPYYPARNSSRDAWFAAADALRGLGWNPIFIPDTDSPPLPMGRAVDPSAAIDLHRRAAVYAGAALNLFVNNGPAWLASFMEGVPVVILKMIAPGCRATEVEHFVASGFPPGSQLGRPGHWIAWEDDTAEAILRAIEPRGAVI